MKSKEQIQLEKMLQKHKTELQELRADIKHLERDINYSSNDHIGHLRQIQHSLEEFEKELMFIIKQEKKTLKIINNLQK